MNTIEEQMKINALLEIKRIIESDVNGDKFIINRTKKNINFMRNYELNDNDVKNIIKQLSIEDYYGILEKDRDEKYKGFVYKFAPVFKGKRLYIKIRLESSEKSVCISVHEFGMYSEVS